MTELTVPSNPAAERSISRPVQASSGAVSTFSSTKVRAAMAPLPSPIPRRREQNHGESQFRCDQSAPHDPVSSRRPHAASLKGGNPGAAKWSNPRKAGATKIMASAVLAAINEPGFCENRRAIRMNSGCGRCPRDAPEVAGARCCYRRETFAGTRDLEPSSGARSRSAVSRFLRKFRRHCQCAPIAWRARNAS